MARMLVNDSSYWSEKPMISSLLSGMDDSRVARGAPFSRMSASMSFHGA